jgi:hypothetical protein
MSLFEYPKALAPTIVRGWVQGKKLRWESLLAQELTTGVYDPIPGISIENDGFRIKNLKPQLEGMYGLTHIQKYSLKGWLLQDPYCLFYWNFTKLQDFTQNPDGGWSWKPGTEVGWTARTPGWRWDIAGTNGKHWIWTNGRVAEHWD